MIAVIADDFTGAAEIGGVGLRYGLKVVIATTVSEPEEADLIVIATDTRSMEAEDAAHEVETVTRQILQLNPDFIFKKVDSALRGNIVTEIESQLTVLGRKKSILVPGNPGHGRIIKNGHYFINGIPLNETFFASDPDFPSYSSSVTEIIGRYDLPVITRANGDELPETGIIVGDVSSREEMSAWARQINEGCLAAGGSDFFNHILARNYPLLKSSGRESYFLDGKSLFILGSLYPKRDRMIGKINGDGLSEINMPEEIYRNRDFDRILLDRWADDIVRRIDRENKAIVTVHHEIHDEPGLSNRIRVNIGLLVRRIFERTEVRHLLIEGGATTHEILKNLQISKLYPYRELGPGIIQMRVAGYRQLCLTTKPGSYNWPENVELKREK
jgi:uncharacterized protein YgbK (DUF1537 family)